MSRSRHWTYTAPVAQDAETRWTSFWDTCAGIPVAYVPTGGGDKGTDTWTVVLYANRAKARRLKPVLDTWFGAPGRLEPLDLRDDEHQP